MYRIILSAILIIIAGVINYPLHAACLSEPGNPGTSTSCGAAASNSISTQGNTSEVSSASSNPINAINGNKYQEEIDMPALPGEFGLELVRHYNSSLHAFGYTGYGWRLSYETDLFADEHTIQINQADGYRIIFTRDRKDPTICTPNDPARGTIVINKTAKGEEYIWIWANGRSLYFNHMGKLERITSASGQTMHFYRGLKGELIRVTDPQGRSMTFEYASKKSKGFRGIIAVNTPVGRYEYQHNDDKKSAGFGNLMSVKYPQEKIGTHGQNEEERKIFNNVNHVERHYHYGEITEVAENKNSLPNEQQAAHFLTGITVNWQDAEGKAQQQRINTWGYNAQGRAMFSVLGPYDPTAKKAGPGQLTLRFSNPDQYTEKDTQKQDLSKPQTPHGHHQHEHKSLVNTTILIDGLGQQSIVKHTVIAGQYRLIEVTGVGCSSCPENNMQYRYDNLARLVDKIKLKPDGKPLYIIRKSFDKASRVKEISRIDYANDKELPAQLLRRFEYPVLAQDKADFIQKAKGYEAAKLTQQTYAVYNQPNLIAMPSVVKGKEHQWRITYNQYGQPTQITETGYRPALPTDKTKAPILISRTLSYQYKQIDGKNLLAQIDGPLPNGKTNTPQDSDITQYQYDKLGRYLTQVIAPMNRFTTLSYDETNGLITSVINSAGQQTAINYANGLPTQITQWHESDATHKQTIQYQYDMFGNQIEQSVNNRPTMARGFDESGRLQWQANALGFLKQVTYDTEGKVLTSGVYSKNYAQVESYHYDAFNRLTQISDNAGRITNVKPFSSAHQSTKWAGYQSIVDDFGREIASISPTNNVDFRQYNVVNQLVEQTSSSGAKLKFTYNLAGQRTSQTVSSATQKPETTRWQYKNHQLLSIFHPNQDEYFQYSAQAQPSVHTVTLRLQDGNKVTHTTVYQYHSDGSLKSQSLPDGTWIEYQRNGQGQVTALTHQTSPRKIFGWGEQTIVKDLQRDITGLSHLTYGNGIEARWQRSQQGILARVVYTTPNTLNAKKQQLADIKHLMMPIADSLISKAYAQAQTNIKEKQTAQSYEPGALGLAEDPNAIFDARLLYDTRGNVLLQQQNGKGIQQSQAYAYDRRYQLVAKQSTPSRQMANEHGKVWRYHYDQFGNRVLAQENVMPNEMGDTIKTNYDTATGLAINTKTTKPFDTNQYNWNALGQLVSVKQGDQHIAQYRYNSTGLRVAKQINNKQGQQNTYTLYNMQRQRVADLNGQGEIVRQYIWLGDQLVATLDAKEPKRLQIPANGFASELSQTIQALWHSLINQQDKLAFVHVNHLHAPIAVTDTQTNVIWQADYAPYGELIKTGGSQPAYQLALRNAGQWQDDKTGLYYNDFRYYNPKTGRYISQDPLGKMAERLGSPNPYSYVNNNPISYIDPWGLVLFAFDGTGNTDDPNQLAALENGFSNVFNFRELYDDGNARYISGVGTIDYSDFNRPIDPKDYVPAIVKLLPFATTIEKDMAFNYSGRARIERMQEYFNAEADLLEDDNQAMDVDIIGFSRGAAQARDFANQIMKNTKQDLLGNNWYAYKDPQNRPQCQKVNFRFMGLWDTVLSTDAPLGTYNLHVPEAFQHVAHAIALNEHRGDTFRTLPGSTGAFPLESIVGGTIPANQTRIEKGFIGAHADIGGGFATKNQLAQVALAWMVKQAELAGVKMNDSSELHIISANPVIHDKSDNQYARDTVAKPADNNEDRTVTYQDVSTVKQKDMTTAGMTWLDTQNFITYNPPDVGTREILFNGTIKETYAEKPADASVGTVDMTAYLAWLKAHGYTLGDLQVQ